MISKGFRYEKTSSPDFSGIDTGISEGTEMLWCLGSFEIVGFGAEGAEKNRISAPKAPKNFRDFGIDLGVGIDLTRLTGIPVTGICDADHKHLYHLPKMSESCVGT